MHAIDSLRHRRAPGRAGAVFSGPGIAAIVLVACGLAALAAISDSPIVIGLFVGVVLGIFLLRVPRVALWVCIVGALLVSGFLSLFFPSLIKVTWLFSMLGFFLTFASLIHLLSKRGLAAGTPGFVWFGLVFMLYALVVAPLAGSSIGETFAGAKRYFQFWGLMFAGAWLLRNTLDFDRLVKLLLGLALLQLPLALYQRIVLVPLRTGLGNGVVPIDVVSGTFEATLLGGGNSSAMVLFLIVALAFTLSAWREGKIASWMCLLLTLLLLVPMGLGETKVVVVFLPLMLLVVFGRYVRQAPFASLSILMIGLAVTALLFWIYGTYFGKPGYSFAQRLQATIDYNFGNVGYYGAFSLNRTTALTYWWSNHGLANPQEWMFGHGLGSSYFAPSSLIQGHVAREHRYIGIGFSAASSILWDLGVAGLLLLLAMFVSAWRTARRLVLRAPSGWGRSAMLAVRATLLLFGALLFYTDSMLNSLSVQCLLMICLGGLAAADRYWARGAAALDREPLVRPASRFAVGA